MTASLRDPAGQLFTLNGRILRLVNSKGSQDLLTFLNSNTCRQFTNKRQLVTTKVLDPSEIEELCGEADFQKLFQIHAPTIVAEHERISFPSFPYEWAPEMLYAAGQLTLDLAMGALTESFGLKDATPYNILFRGTQPVFVDLLSFERREPDDPTWLPNAQFIRTFLLPLLVNKHFGLGLEQLLLTRRDGLEPEEVYSLLGFSRKFRPPFLSLVTIPSLLVSQSKSSERQIYEKRRLGNPEKARFIFEQVLKGLRRRLNNFAPVSGKSSTWSDYMVPNRCFTPEYLSDKDSQIERAMLERRPTKVLDVGCNTGHFSLMAAKSGATVVAVDYDPVVVGQVWREAHAENLDILPLVVNLARPTPGVGWRNLECPSFIERARGSFDLVMMLAVVHHLLVSEGIPLAETFDLAAELTTDALIIEFVPSDDPMFRRLTRGREELYQNYHRAYFETIAMKHFVIIKSSQLATTNRWLYVMRKKPLDVGINGERLIVALSSSNHSSLLLGRNCSL